MPSHSREFLALLAVLVFIYAVKAVENRKTYMTGRKRLLIFLGYAGVIIFAVLALTDALRDEFDFSVYHPRVLIGTTCATLVCLIVLCAGRLLRLMGLPIGFLDRFLKR
jgi:hypothetical protein